MKNVASALCMIAATMMLLTGCDNHPAQDCKDRGGEVHSVDFRDANNNPKRSYYCTVNGKIVDRW